MRLGSAATALLLGCLVLPTAACQQRPVDTGFALPPPGARPAPIILFFELDRADLSADAEATSARLLAQCSAIDRAMFDPASAPAELASMTMSELSRRRAKVAAELEAAEARWLELGEKLERIAA